MLKINFLEGYAGLRLKDGKALEIRKGINLFVGRNGSGKSNLATLIKYIFNKDLVPTKKLFESPYLQKNGDEAVANLKDRIKEKNENIEEVAVTAVEFGQRSFCNFSFNEIEGNLALTLESEIRYISFYSMLKEAYFNNNGFLVLSDQHSKYKVTEIVPKIDLNNEEVLIESNFKFFKSSQPSNANNPIVESIISNFNDFFGKRLEEFRLNDEKLLQRIKELNEKLLIEYNNFFSPTDKKLYINLDPAASNNRALILKDGNYVISFDALSDGEKNLFNLVINLSTARSIKPDLILFDEPELFMHDDMIRTLAIELQKLSADLPDTCIILSTHSSALIEELANAGKEKVNLIAINNKQVFNSNEDIDFINALANNGVRFSPLFISKRPNIFIENKGSAGQIHSTFLLSFFEDSKQPNIIPIGSSGQVKTYENYLEVIENIIQTQAQHTSIGIMDGDMLLVKEFDTYFKKELSINDLIGKLTDICRANTFLLQDDDLKGKRVYYFSYWEIENLYLDSETLSYWKNNKSQNFLDKAVFIEIIKGLKVQIIDSWLKTYKHSIFKPVYFDRRGKDYVNILNQKIKDLQVYDQNEQIYLEMMDSFYEQVLEHNLFSWFPGKEIYNKLLNDYTFSIDDIDFSKLKLSSKIRAIVNEIKA